MNRGRIALLTDEGLYRTSDLNGGMDVNCYGKEIIPRLEKISNLNEYKKFVTEFTTKYFNDEGNKTIQEIIYFRHIGRYFNMSKDYFENWLSENLYIKNIAWFSQKIILKGDFDILLNPGQVVVLKYGNLSDDYCNNNKLEKFLGRNSINKFEELGWTVREYHNTDSFEIRNCSPAGEDLCETLYKSNPIFEQLKIIADNFDAEKHAVMWYNTRGKGAPTSLKDLLTDADAIQTMYDDIVEKFSK